MPCSLEVSISECHFSASIGQLFSAYSGQWDAEERASREGLRMTSFARVRNCAGLGQCLGCAVGLAVEHEAIRVVSQPVEGGRGEQAVGGEGLVPFREVEIAGDDRGGGFVAFGDEVVQILVSGKRPATPLADHSDSAQCPVFGVQRCGNSSWIRLAGCVGSRWSTSLR